MIKRSGKIRSKVKYPKKTSLNLLIEEKDNMSDPKVQIALFLAFIVLLLFFTKIMVVNKLSDAYGAQARYEAMQNEIAELHVDNSDYDKIKEEYSHYGNGYLNEEEQAETDRLVMLSVINANVTDDADIQSIEISGNVATLAINDINLKMVSSIVASLEGNDTVSYVSVSTAGKGAESSADVTATFTVEFKPSGGVAQ